MTMTRISETLHTWQTSGTGTHQWILLRRQNTMTRTSIGMMTGIGLAVVWCVASSAAEPPPPGHQPLRYIGYYHDGSGVFRDATPVTSWNEWDFKEVETGEKDGRGRPVKVTVPDRERRVNIVWKVPHYNWCNGGMIVAGGKLFAMSDRAGLGFYADRLAEFAGAELFCIDPADGKTIWKIDLDHWDLVPNGAELRKTLLEYNRKGTEIYRAWCPLGNALRDREGGVKLSETHYQELAKPARVFFADLPGDLAGLKGTIFDNTGYEQIHFMKLLPKYFPAVVEMRKKIQAAGYLLDPWGGKYDHLGINMQTPVSDGKRVWICTAYGGVFCADLNGKIIWKKWLGGGWDRAAAIPSPVLAGDLLITIGRESQGRQPRTAWIALDTKNGRQIWDSPFRGSYQQGPIVLDLPLGGDANNKVQVLYCQNGTVLRVTDGRILVSGLGVMYTGRPCQVYRDIIVTGNTYQDGGGSAKSEFPEQAGCAALRLKAENADKVVAEVLWQGKKMDVSGLVARDGVLFHRARDGKVESYDLLMGNQIGKTSGACECRPTHYSILVGEYILGLSTDGKTGVTQVSQDGKTLKVIGTNRLGDRYYHHRNPDPLGRTFNGGAQPFASGNRVFVRSNTDLYCIGDPNQPMRLSREHR